MDISISFPDEGCIRLQSRFLFADPTGTDCQSFVERVLNADGVSSVAIKGAGRSSGPTRPRFVTAQDPTPARTLSRRFTRAWSTAASLGRLHVVRTMAHLSTGSRAANGKAHTANGHPANGHPANGRRRPGEDNGDGFQSGANGHAHGNGVASPVRRPNGKSEGPGRRRRESIANARDLRPSCSRCPN